ncbi:MAG: SpoVR family protein [bacterium]|nr:SpoVR family protein [bacterium]
MTDWTIKDLERYEEAISKIAKEEGLNCFEQEYEICDHAEMIGYMAYNGMPAHYPHWSFGKSFERSETLYRYGVQGLPYEMVINADPSLAYLMRSNSLALHIVTIAHAGCGHNDFFKNNRCFRHTRPEYTMQRFKTHADRVREYTKDPSIGRRRVEQVLTAAHALSLHRRRNIEAPRLNQAEQRKRLFESAQPRKDEWTDIHSRPDYKTPDLSRVPLEPEEDILLFIRDFNPSLESWEKDLLTIVAEESDYFWPQIETKIMNEGWATYWHYKILNSLKLPPELHLEFLKLHNQVIAPHIGSINPYRLGFELFKDIYRRWENPTPEEKEKYGLSGGEGKSKIFSVRAAERDISFLHQYLTEEFLRRFFFVEYAEDEEEIMITDTVDEHNWQDFRGQIVQNTGSNSIPDIRVYDSNFKNAQTLLALHCFDGRELHPEYAAHTLRHFQTLWRRRVHLLTWNLREKACWLYTTDPSDKITQHKHCESPDCPLRKWLKERGQEHLIL